MTQDTEPEQDSALALAEAEAFAALDASRLQDEQRTESLRPDHLERRSVPAQQDANWEEDATCHYLRDAAGILQARPANKNEITGARDVRPPPSATPEERDWDEEQSTTHFERALPAERSSMLSGLLELSSLLEPDDQPPTTTLPSSSLRAARVVNPPNARRPPPPPKPRATRAAWQSQAQQGLPVTTYPNAVAHAVPVTTFPAAVAHAGQSQLHERRVSAPASLAPELRKGFEADPRTSLRPGRSRWLWSLSAALPICALLGAYAVWVDRSPRQPRLASAASAPVAHDDPRDSAFTLRSTPEGAQISIDGTLTGRATPARIAELTPGPHSIEFSLVGYVTANVPAVARPGEQLELPNVELQPVAIATIDAADAAARTRTHQASGSRIASTRGERAGSSPTAAYARRILSAVEASPSDEAESEVRAAAMSGTGLLQINSRPWARILVDGGFVGHTPQRALKLVPGRHTVRLVNEAFSMSKTIEVTIASGQTIRRVEALDEDAVPAR